MAREHIEINITSAEDPAISQTIARAFGELLNRDPVDLDFALYDYIDPEALDNLFQTDVPESLTVEFHVEDWFVAIHRGDSACFTIEVETRE